MSSAPHIKLGEGFRNCWASSQLSIEPTSLDPEARNRPGADDFFMLPEFQEPVITFFGVVAENQLARVT